MGLGETEQNEPEQATPSNGRHPERKASNATGSDADEVDAESSDFVADRLFHGLKQLFVSFRDVSSMTVFASEDASNSEDTRIATATNSNAPEKQTKKNGICRR